MFEDGQYRREFQLGKFACVLMRAGDSSRNGELNVYFRDSSDVRNLVFSICVSLDHSFETIRQKTGELLDAILLGWKVEIADEISNDDD